MQERLRQMLPKGTRFYAQPPRFKLENGSEIHIKSCDPSAGVEKFQGAGITAAWFDEEPVGENGRQIFHEVYARREKNVSFEIFMTFTPLQGFSWSFRELWDPKTRVFPDVETFVVTQDDASVSHGGFWTEEELADFRAGYSEAEYDARVKGKWGQLFGKSYFSAKLIDSAKEKCDDGKRYAIRYSPIGGAILEEKPSGPLTIYRPPTAGRQYIIGVDAAGGAGRDGSVASVWDRDDLACCAEWYSNSVDPDDFGANAVLPLALYYGNPLVVVEANGEHGGTVLAQLKGRYTRLYRHREWNRIQSKYTTQYGWKTTAANRMRILDALAKALREGNWTPNRDLLDEMSTTVLKDDGRVEHMDGCHDDRVFAAGIAMAVHWDSPRYSVSRPEVVEYEGENAWMGV